MESLENNTLIATLLSIYGNLLGKAELRRAEKHYFDDLSIAEIAQNENTSRNAVYLSLKSAKKKLEYFDKVLNLREKENKTIELLDRIAEIDETGKTKDSIKEIRRIWTHGI